MACTVTWLPVKYEWGVAWSGYKSDWKRNRQLQTYIILLYTGTQHTWVPTKHRSRSPSNLRVAKWYYVIHSKLSAFGTMNHNIWKISEHCKLTSLETKIMSICWQKISTYTSQWMTQNLKANKSRMVISLLLSVHSTKDNIPCEDTVTSC